MPVTRTTQSTPKHRADVLLVAHRVEVTEIIVTPIAVEVREGPKAFTVLLVQIFVYSSIILCG